MRLLFWRKRNHSDFERSMREANDCLIYGSKQLRVARRYVSQAKRLMAKF